MSSFAETVVKFQEMGKLDDQEAVPEGDKVGLRRLMVMMIE